MDFSQPRSLCLGGGAARGFIHVGVWKRLEEHNLFPHEIVGNSMGSAISASIALGMSSEEIIRAAVPINRRKFIDVNLRYGLLGGKKVYAFLSDFFGTKTFSDTKIPLTITTVDINTGEKVLFKTGRIVDAVMASMSVPTIFVPFLHQGRRLVDGGVISNLPIEDTAYTNVLASSSLPPLDYPVVGKAIHKGKKLKKTFFRNTGRILGKVFQCSIQINEEKSLTTPGKQVVLIRPLHTGFRRVDFHKINEMVTIGYEETKKILS